MFATKTARLGINRSNREFLQRCFSKTVCMSNNNTIIGVRPQNQLTESETTRWTLFNKYNYNRALSTNQIETTVSEKKKVTIGSKDDVRDLMAMFPDIVRDLREAGTNTGVRDEVVEWFTKVLQYNVPTGKKVRALSAIMAYKMLVDPKDLTPENIKLINILGWCNELFQSFLLMTDDVMDSSETRRGSTCWYKVPGVGLGAINDTILLHMSIFYLLRKYFSKHPAYLDIIELFHNVTFKTSTGQCLDALCLNDGQPNLNQFSMKRYNSIIKYKAGYYTFHLPVAVAMHFAGIKDPELHRQAKTILMEMGSFFQIQDDFLDCFGNTSITGKKGADIREGKCTWLVVVALQRATPAQRKLLDVHYGKSEPESIQRVKNLYEELNIPKIYAAYEEESFNMFKTHIQQISQGLPHGLFFKFIDWIYKREH